MVCIKNLMPSTTQRVSQNTDPNINAKIRKNTILNLNKSKHCGEYILTKKIQKLNYEWDTERVIEVNAAIAVLISIILGLKHNKKWFALTGTVGAFLLQHALLGWCPSLPIIRRLGIRTAEEINVEKIVLKLMRGDFLQSNNMNYIIELIKIAEK